MKLVPKKQKGGSFLNYFTDYAILQPATEKPVAGSSPKTKEPKEEKEKGKISEKDLFGILNSVDGLPNEMKQLTTDMLNMYQQAELFGDDIDSRSLASLYAKNMYKVKEAGFNKKEYDKAYQILSKNDGLNEFAITENGKIVAYNKDQKLTNISVKEYLSNPSDYQAITNQQLLWLRAHDPQFVNNNNVFQITNNGIGINQIQKEIQDRLGNLGTSELNYSGNISVKDKNILAGASLIQQLSESEQANLGLDGLYKAKIITKEQNQQAQKALQYIYGTLSTSAKTILALRSGDKENPEKGAMETIWNLISSKTSPTREVSMDLENTDPTGAKQSKGKKGSGGIGDIDESVASRFLSGYGAKEYFTINPGTNLSIDVAANTMPLVKANGDQLGANTSLQEVSQGQFGGVLDWQKVTIGGRKIDPIYLDRVLVSDGQVRSIDFPVDANGNPDLRPTTLEQKKKAEQEIAAAGIDINNVGDRAINANKINAIMQHNGLSAIYDKNGELIQGRWGRFAVMNGTADNRVLSQDPLDSPNNFLSEITDDDRIDTYDRIIAEKTKTEIKRDKNDWGFLEGDYDMLMEGTIWIPLKVDYHASQAGITMTGAEAYELEKAQLQNNKRNQLLNQYNNPGQP